MGEILLIAADWRLRALVRAQLLEEGFQVRALPSLEVALAHLSRGGEGPGLVRRDAGGVAFDVQSIVFDTQGAAYDAQAVSELRRLCAQTPLILCGGAWSQLDVWQEGLAATRVLRRPFRVGDVIDEVRRNWRCLTGHVTPE